MRWKYRKGYKSAKKTGVVYKAFTNRLQNATNVDKVFTKYLQNFTPIYFESSIFVANS